MSPEVLSHVPDPHVALQHRDPRVVVGAAQVDDLFHTSPVQIPITSGSRCCATKFSYDAAGRPIKDWGVAVVQDNDAVVPQVARGVFLTSRSTCT